MIRSVIFAVLLFCGISAAQDSFSMDKLNDEIQNPLGYSVEDAGAKPVSPVFLFFRIVGSLAILTALVFAVVWGIKKSGVLQPVAVNTESSLEFLDELTTGSGNSVVLVRFGDKVLVLGQTGSSMSVLETVDGLDAQTLIAKSAGGKSVGSFRANLNKYVMNLQKGSGRG